MVLSHIVHTCAGEQTCMQTHKLMSNICFASTYKNIPLRNLMLIRSGSASGQKVSWGDCLLYLQTQVLRS